MDVNSLKVTIRYRERTLFALQDKGVLRRETVAVSGKNFMKHVYTVWEKCRFLILKLEARKLTAGFCRTGEMENGWLCFMQLP
jgi:hypothetical protein